MLNSNEFRNSGEFSFDFMDSMSNELNLNNTNDLMEPAKMGSHENNIENNGINSFGLNASPDIQAISSKNQTANNSLDMPSMDMPPPPDMVQTEIFEPVTEDQNDTDTSLPKDINVDISSNINQMLSKSSQDIEPIQPVQQAQKSPEKSNVKNDKTSKAVDAEASEASQSNLNSPVKAFVIDSTVNVIHDQTKSTKILHENENHIDLTSFSKSVSPSMHVTSLHEFGDHGFNQRMQSQQMQHEMKRQIYNRQHGINNMSMLSQQQPSLAHGYGNNNINAMMNTSMIVTLRHHNYFDRFGNQVENAARSPITLPTKFGNIVLTVDHFEFRCIYPGCSKIFELTNDLYDHIRDNHQEWQMRCPKSGCGRNFKCMATLVYHARRHTPNKPYICPLPGCSFITAAKGNLKAHLYVSCVIISICLFIFDIFCIGFDFVCK